MHWYAGIGLLAVALLTALWLAVGRGPRRRRAHRRAVRLLHRGQWREALAAVRDLQALGPLPPRWEGRVRNAEGECLRAAGLAALAEKDYETSVEHHVAAARLLGLNEAEVRGQVVGAMLNEVYLLFASKAGPAEAQSLLARVLTLQAPCPEASFWLGLCHVRADQTDLALQALRQAHEGAKNFLDPALYLGILLLRSGQVQEALRYLSEANRVDASCPFVAWQLGTAIAAAGGDAGLAVRALQKALGPHGLPQWVKAPEKAWAGGMPGPTRSYVARLAAQHRYVCPLLGGDVGVMVRQAFFTLGQAQYRQGNYPEAANVFANLLQDAPPTAALLRGLGLALARQARYDEAFKHLRAAHEQEEPKNPFTAGYLALCGARGKPSRPEDKPSNVLWAARLLGRFHLPGDVEWAGLHRAIYAEARAVGLALGAEDLARGGDVLAGVDAADPEAAATYDQLGAAFPDLVKPAHAFLYCRAAQEHGFRGQADLDLFALAFARRAELESFFGQRGWNVEDVEATYLARWAESNPGRFPDVLGPDYAASGERLLAERSARQEAAGESAAALASAAVLSRLMPHNGRALDRLARLHYVRGELDVAARVLHNWEDRHPGDPVPRLRRAVVERQRGHGAACAEALERALQLAQGPYRAEVAYLGARLALSDVSEAHGPPSAGLERALHLLGECLREQPDHAGALGLRAALLWQSGDRQALIDQAPWLDRPDVADPRFQYFAAVAHYAAGNDAAALDAADRAVASPALALEGRYLVGLAQLRRGDYGSAVAALEKVARSPETPSVNHARAVLGDLHFKAGSFEAASQWWQMLDAPRRAAWTLDEPLRGTVFLAALQAYQSGRFDHAADKLREAGRLGLRDRRLGPLLHLALFKAGQHLYHLVRSRHTHNGLDLLDAERLTQAAHLLGQALSAGAKDPAAAYLLAMAYKHRDNPKEARAALRKIAEPDANVWLQMGLLSLRDGQPAQAETEFARAWEADVNDFAAGANLLLTRLSFGQTDAATVLAPRVIALAPPAEARLLTLLRGLLQARPSANGDARADTALGQMSADEEQRLLDLLRGLGHLDTVCLLVRLLSTARPESGAAREAAFEAVLLKGKKLVDRCDWNTAYGLLKLLTRQRETSPVTLAALFNLLGCTAALCQDFGEAAQHFATAARLAPNDPGVHQNLALAYEWQRDIGRAEPHWNRYLDLLERRLTPSPSSPDSVAPLLFEGLNRLAAAHSEKERWASALPYLERAHRLRPDDTEALEKLFSLYSQLRRADDARRVLHRLRHLKPGEGQYDLYELDLTELRDIDDIDRWVGEVGRVVQNHAGQPRVEERALNMIGNIVPLLAKTSDQLTEQLNKVMRQVRGLQNYQINWQAVHEVMRDLRREFQKVRRTVGKCMAVVTHPEHRRVLRSLGEHVDRKIEFCREWQGN